MQTPKRPRRLYPKQAAWFQMLSAVLVGFGVFYGTDGVHFIKSSSLHTKEAQWVRRERKAWNQYQQQLFLLTFKAQDTSAIRDWLEIAKLHLAHKAYSKAQSVVDTTLRGIPPSNETYAWGQSIWLAAALANTEHPLTQPPALLTQIEERMALLETHHPHWPAFLSLFATYQYKKGNVPLACHYWRKIPSSAKKLRITLDTHLDAWLTQLIQMRCIKPTLSGPQRK